MNKSIVGVGLLLQTKEGSFLFQERDVNTDRNPGMIAPFGGGIEGKETTRECAIRELEEELELTITDFKLKELGVYESHFKPGTYIELFLVDNIVLEKLRLHEGKKIRELTLAEALDHPMVTDFTKQVLRGM